jgi:hypothetical protein
MSTNRKDKNVWGIPSIATYLTSIMIREKRHYITLIPPFSRKRTILPGKYIQVLSISHKMADYFAFPLLL